MHDRLRALTALRSPLAPLLAVVLCLLIGMGMVFSILAVYVQSLGAPASMVGVVIACFGGARLAVNMPAGLASERLGRRAVMLGGLAMFILGSFGAAATDDIGLLIVWLFAQGAGAAAVVTAALAAVADLGTPETRMADMAAYQAAQLGSVAVGPAVGGITAAYAGYEAVFLLQGIMAVLALALLALSRATGAMRGAAEAAKPPRIASRIRLPAGAFGLASAIYGVYFARVAANWVLMPLLARDALAMSVVAIGAVLTLGAIVNFAVLPFAARLARRIGRRAVVVATNLATILVLAMLASATSEPVLWVTGALLGATSGFAAPALSAMTADAAPPGQLGAAMGFMRTLTDLATVTGPILTGLVVDQLGYGYAGGLLACAAVLAAATAVFVLARPPAPPPAQGRGASR